MNYIEDLERKLDQLLKEPSNPQLLNEIGVILYQMKDWQSAELYLQRAYQLCPRNADFLYNNASLQYVQCKWQQAITFYQAYLELHSDDKDVIEKVENLCYLLGDYQ